MRKYSLLLISGNQVLMDSIKKILESDGYSVCCASFFAGARERHVDFMPDGIIVENDLVDDRGLDYCREIRKESDVPILLLSNDKEDELPALRAGANDFLNKPYDYDIMLARIGIMLNARIRSTNEADEGLSVTKVTPNTKTIPEYPVFSQLDETVPESPQKKNTFGIRRLYMAAAAMVVSFAVLFVGAEALRSLSGEQYLDIPAEPVPLASFEFEEDFGYNNVTEHSIEFPIIDDITIPAGSTDAKILLSNPSDNPCYFEFEIVLADAGEVLYLSDLVEPGACIEDITLNRGLGKGEYSANIRILAYALDGFSAMSSECMELLIKAY